MLGTVLILAGSVAGLGVAVLISPWLQPWLAKREAAAEAEAARWLEQKMAEIRAECASRR